MFPVLALALTLAQQPTPASDKLWGGRFAESPSAVFEQFSESLSFDRRLIEADIRGSQAYARGLERVGILNANERERMVAAFDAVLDASRTKPDFYKNAKDEDIHSLVIREVKERAGTLADKIHTGRSRNEQVSLDTRLYLRGEIDVTRAQILDVMDALVKMARKYPNAVIPGFTHTRRAQAVLFPHYLLAYFEMFARDRERLEETRRRVNLMPMGSGALAGSGFDYDRVAMARELGFDGVTANSMDVSADRDFVLDYLHAANTTALHLSRLAEDWILYSSDEFGWMELSDKVTSGSSLMPQKKNPDSLELIRGKAGRAFSGYSSLFVTMKGLPLTYDRDMQEDKEPLFTVIDQLHGMLAMARNVIDTTAIKPDRALSAVDDSWMIATDLAEELSRIGVPFHQAHPLVGRLVLESIKAGKKPADWTAEQLVAFSPLFKPEMLRLMKASEGMKTRNVAGGTGPAAVARALDEAQRKVAEWKSARR